MPSEEFWGSPRILKLSRWRNIVLEHGGAWISHLLNFLQLPHLLKSYREGLYSYFSVFGRTFLNVNWNCCTAVVQQSLNLAKINLVDMAATGQILPRKTTWKNGKIHCIQSSPHRGFTLPNFMTSAVYIISVIG